MTKSEKDDLVSPFPAQSRFQRLITALVDTSEEVRVQACHEIQNLDRFDSWQGARTPSWFVEEGEARAILKVAAEFDFPLPKNDWQDGFERLMSLLWRSPHSSLTALMFHFFSLRGLGFRFRHGTSRKMCGNRKRDYAVSKNFYDRSPSWPQEGSDAKGAL